MKKLVLLIIGVFYKSYMLQVDRSIQHGKIYNDNYNYTKKKHQLWQKVELYNYININNKLKKT